MSYLRRFEHSFARGGNTVQTGGVLAHFSNYQRKAAVHPEFKAGNFYMATSVSVTTALRSSGRGASGARVHTLGLRKLTWCEDSGKWAFASNEFSMRFASEDMYQFFGVMQDRHVGARGGPIFTYLQDKFQKLGKGDDFDVSKDWDRILSSIGFKVLSAASVKVPPEDAKDIIMDTVLNTFDDRTILRYDPARTKGGLVGYVGGIFRKRMISALRKWIRQHKKDFIVRDREDGDTVSPFDRVDPNRPPTFESPERVVLFKDLIRDLSKFFFKQRKGETLVRMLPMLLKDAKGKEIAVELGMSEGNVTFWLKKMKKLLVAYARESRNGLLINLLAAKGLAAGHDLLQSLEALFKEYRKQASVNKGPVGEITKVEKFQLEDPKDDVLLTGMTLDTSISQKEMDSKVGQSTEILNQMDDLIEEEDGLIGLRIKTSEIRNI